MKAKLRAASAALALVSALATALPGGSARAQWIVFDPNNFGQNVLTAAHTLEQINNQIHSLQNEAQMILNQGQMLVNQARNLENLVYSPMAMLQQDIARTQALIAQAQGLATQVEQLDRQFSQQYPSSYGANTSIDQTVADARTRWNNSLEALRTTLELQGQVNASITADTQTLANTVGSSQGAVGILQAVQATNQLLALQAKQAMQSQQLRVTQDRATALELSRTLEADQQAQAARAQFQGSGVAYTPASVQVYAP